MLKNESPQSTSGGASDSFNKFINELVVITTNDSIKPKAHEIDDQCWSAALLFYSTFEQLES